MRKRLNISIAWILLVLLFYNLGGYLLVFDFSEIINRSFVHKILSDTGNDKLQLLKIPGDDSFTRNGDDEIIYHGKRFDVKKEFKKDGVNYFYCINDKEEENIYANLNAAINKNSDAKNENQNSSANTFLKHLVKDYFLKDFLNPLNDTSKCFYVNLKNKTILNHVFINIITPPPELLFS